ncbi:MAG TPA: hypothetical protein PKD10_05325 [Paracoccaceae bacterium]|mgnify:CR=1 FL=1|nr:hypothetical protein [Paracoccaceae bacterium]
MTRKPRQPLLDSPRWVRQRQRTDGTWRVWWEPPASLRKHGLAPVDLPADNPRAALRQAQQLNAAADAALAGGATAVRRGGGRTIEDLAQAYRASPHYRHRLAAKTRASYDGLLRLIVDKWGHRRAADMDKPVMLAWYAALAEARGLRQAQALVRMMSILMELAEAMGWRVEGSNPCSRLRTITPPPRARVVGWAEFDALVAAAEGAGQPALALAMRLGLYTGQRQTDILRARRGAFALLAAGPHRGRWVWRLVRSKRGTDGAFPIHPDLLPALRRALADSGTAAAPLGPESPLLIDGATGRPFSEALFNTRFARARAAAARLLPSVADVQFRDLRRSFGVLARAGGASDDDVGDVLGNSVADNPRLQETYLPPSFDTAARAVAAVRRPQAQRQPAKGHRR